MSKRINDMKWESVALEGFPLSMKDQFQSFVGLEECTDYSLDKEGKRSKKNKLKEFKEKIKARKEKRKLKNSEASQIEVPNKKVKLSNGFVVESCQIIKPSITNILSQNKAEKHINGKLKDTTNNKNVTKKNKQSKISMKEECNSKLKDVTNIKIKTKKKEQSKDAIKEEIKASKPKLGDLPQSESILTPEDMLTWAEFKLQEPILKALTELGFKQPTKIQQLTLPAAIHGRRDILGAAETGSGKTLAFGLPILSGILKLKEKAELKGLDVYDIPYKKGSTKKKDIEVVQKDKSKKNRDPKLKNKNDTKVEAPKESSEEDSSDGEESNEEIDEVMPLPKKDVGSDDDYIEEIEVPIRKRNSTSVDEENDSDDENYIHLSDMLDSDDLAETSDDEGDDKSEEVEDEGYSEQEVEKDDNDLLSEDDDVVNEEGGESPDERNENEQGIGCVKVVDDIEIPGHVSMKTGKPLYALIITPTRELAIQISRHLIAAAKYTGIRVATIVGGMAAVKQERVLRSGPEVVVATPGRLWELIGQGQPHLQQLDSVKFLAIDETDRMVERGHFEELYPLLERLNADEAKMAARQNFVFSATLTLVHDLPSHMKGKKVTKRGKVIHRKIEKMSAQQKVSKLVKMIGMTEPKVVDITTQNLGTAETLTESRITCSTEHKDANLYYILKRHPGRTIVFCNSIGSVRRLAQLLTLLKCRPLPLHANMPQRQRLKNLERFRDDPHGVLIATDVAARGLDIPCVEHVVHYQVPRTAEQYVHRSGRTARASREGLTVLMVEPGEAYLYSKLCSTLKKSASGENYVHRSGRTARASREGLTVLMVEPGEAYMYSKLCSTLKKTTELPTFPVEPQILAPLKDLVSIARELDVLELRKRKASQAIGWRERAAKEMDIIIDDDDIPITTMDTSIEKALKAKKRQLETLLERPVYPKGFSFVYPTLNQTNAPLRSEDNALQAMKKAIESGQLKKNKRKSKNAPLLQLQKKFKKK